MTAATRALVRRRADQRCEYCQTHQDDSPLAALHIEHIRPLKHGGSEDDSNLCLAWSSRDFYTTFPIGNFLLARS